MTDECSAAIPLDEFPDPVLAYAVDDGDARITATNTAFERLFDETSSEVLVSTILERLSGSQTTHNRELMTTLVQGCQGEFPLGGDSEQGPFVARVIPSTGDTGYLVLSDPCLHPDTEGTPAVDQVNSVISHDLRNPLDVAKAHLQAARETDDPEHFDSVADAHDRMERIIGDVLTLTREEEVVDPSEQVSIETAATDAWQSVDTEQAVLDLSDSLPTTTADPDRVRRLFENLFRNSIEHTVNASVDSADEDSVAEPARDDGEREAHESKVTITVGSVADGFYVSDDGPGIPPEKQETVFEPGHSTRDGGTGLGLAIVERIAAAHDWDIRLTSADSGGSRFDIRF